MYAIPSSMRNGDLNDSSKYLYFFQQKKVRKQQLTEIPDESMPPAWYV